jgi:hypothetical protein
MTASPSRPVCGLQRGVVTVGYERPQWLQRRHVGVAGIPWAPYLWKEVPFFFPLPSLSLLPSFPRFLYSTLLVLLSSFLPPLH